MIRRYQKEDLECFKKFWTSQDGEVSAEKRAHCFKRLIEGNPFSSTKDDYYVIDEEGSVIAYEGLMPNKFTLLGKDYDGYIYHDTMVEPRKRGQGLGLMLVKELIRENTSFSIAVWMNLPNHKMFEKCGWLPVNKIYSYLRVYDFSPFIHLKNKLFNNFVVKTLNFIFLLKYTIEKLFINLYDGYYSISEIDKFDDRVNDLYYSVKSQFKYISNRTKDVLNWKYTNKGTSRYSIFVYLEDNKIIGYIIYMQEKLSEERFKVTISDFLCSPLRMEIFSSLLKRVILDMELKKPSYIEILSTNEIMNSALKKMGFIRSKEKKYDLKFIHPEGIEDPNELAEGNNWFYTYGDGDKVFWDF